MAVTFIYNVNFQKFQVNSGDGNAPQAYLKHLPCAEKLNDVNILQVGSLSEL
jgi:hypothetical protein